MTEKPLLQTQHPLEQSQWLLRGHRLMLVHLPLMILSPLLQTHLPLMQVWSFSQTDLQNPPAYLQPGLQRHWSEQLSQQYPGGQLVHTPLILTYWGSQTHCWVLLLKNSFNPWQGTTLQVWVYSLQVSPAKHLEHAPWTMQYPWAQSHLPLLKLQTWLVPHWTLQTLWQTSQICPLGHLVQKLLTRLQPGLQTHLPPMKSWFQLQIGLHTPLHPCPDTFWQPWMQSQHWAFWLQTWVLGLHCEQMPPTRQNPGRHLQARMVMSHTSLVLHAFLQILQVASQVRRGGHTPQEQPIRQQPFLQTHTPFTNSSQGLQAEEQSPRFQTQPLSHTHFLVTQSQVEQRVQVEQVPSASSKNLGRHSHFWVWMLQILLASQGTLQMPRPWSQTQFQLHWLQMPLTGQKPVMQQHCPLERIWLGPQPTTQNPPWFLYPEGQPQTPVSALQVVFPGHLVQTPSMRQVSAAHPQVLLMTSKISLAGHGILQIWRLTSKKVSWGQAMHDPSILLVPFLQMHTSLIKTQFTPHQLGRMSGPLGRRGARVAGMQLPLFRVYPWMQSHDLLLALYTAKAPHPPHFPLMSQNPEMQMQVRELRSRTWFCSHLGRQMAFCASQQLGAAHSVQTPLMTQKPSRQMQLPSKSLSLREQVLGGRLMTGASGSSFLAHDLPTLSYPSMHSQESFSRMQYEQGGQTSHASPMRLQPMAQTHRPSWYTWCSPQVAEGLPLGTHSLPTKWQPMMHTHWHRILSQTWLQGQLMATGYGPDAGGVQVWLCDPTLAEPECLPQALLRVAVWEFSPTRSSAIRSRFVASFIFKMVIQIILLLLLHSQIIGGIAFPPGLPSDTTQFLPSLSSTSNRFGKQQTLFETPHSNPYTPHIHITSFPSSQHQHPPSLVYYRNPPFSFAKHSNPEQHFPQNTLSSIPLLAVFLLPYKLFAFASLLPIRHTKYYPLSIILGKKNTHHMDVQKTSEAIFIKFEQIRNRAC